MEDGAPALQAGLARATLSYKVPRIGEEGKEPALTLQAGDGARKRSLTLFAVARSGRQIRRI